MNQKFLSLLLATAAIAIAPPSRAQDMPPQGPASGQPQQLTPAMRADITAGMNYRLPTDFLVRARETLQALQGAGIQPPNSTGMDLQRTIEAMRSVPGLPNVLAAHGFSVETFVMGMTAFGMTLAATNGQQLPPDIPAPNAANVALFHSQPQDVTALMQAMGSPPDANQ